MIINNDNNTNTILVKSLFQITNLILFAIPTFLFKTKGKLIS